MATTPRQRRPLPAMRRAVRPRPRNLQSSPASDAAEANVTIIEHGSLRWLDIRSITPATIEYLREEFNFHPLALDDLTSRAQRPKVDVYSASLFIVMQFPRHDKATRTTFAAEVDIFVGSNYIITIHDGSLKPLTRMFDGALESQEVREALMERTSGHLLYYIIDRLVDYCFPIIDRMSERIEHIEDIIFERAGIAVVQEISIVRRDLIALRRIIKPQMSVIAQLEHRDLPFVRGDIDVYFGDISDHLAKIWDSLEDEKEVLEGLSSTFDSLASHRLNDVIKTLTIISVIILPLTLITGVFGMNVPLPFAHSELALLIITLFMLLTSIAMLVVFRMRRWL
ncbi:MAG: magnesium transporter [Chloroflexi bacterium]|nr:MAG: magnesium transporter [Chloroflexota bacterium]